jgi:RNA polymerase sigma-70 factor (ECF subfamily)
VLLERLGPVERAVFVLHEVFAYPYAEIAEVVGRSEEACRQIAVRARSRVDPLRRPRYHASAEEEQRLVGAFLGAVAGGDVEALVGVLAEDVVVWSDGGPDHHAARRPVRGPDRAARLIVNLAARLPEGWSGALVRVNGDPTVVVRVDDEVVVTVGLELGPDCVVAVWSMVNPDKLRRLARSLPA